ncbi:chorismate-binding protein [Blastococcus sp. SYSU D00695]
MPSARFDDLRAGTALAFDAVERELVATRPEDVVPVLDEVDRLTRAGRWAFGFVAAEAAPGLDPALAVHEPVEGLPLAWFGISPGPATVDVVAPAGEAGPPTGPWVPQWGPGHHRRAVEAVRAHIAAGDVYQCNLTTRLTAPAPADPARLYADLALAQRGAHNAFLDLGRFVVAGASPELFLEWTGDRVLMQPMKGTAARGRTAAEDADAVHRLGTSEKERAENVMIVDLVRNDLARVAVTGSVTVDALCRPERFETVHQLVSDVSSRLLPGTGLADLFRAVFPSGSVTGAPKIRAMELIRELEDGPRGVYCGAVGVVAPPGAPFRARFGVAIRTVLVDRQAGTATYGAGGGITWGSRPDAEYAELLAKARVLATRPDDAALLETMRHEAGRGVRSLDAHLGRMAASAQFLGVPFDAAAARAALAARLAGAGDARVRLLCARDGGLTVELAPLPAPDRRPLRLVIDDEPVDSREWWPHHKTTRREPYERRRARHPDADEVLLVNERGELTEACTANLAVRLDGRWWTPPAGDGCLPGVERARLVAAGVLAERVLVPADLHRAEGLALVNSLRGWRPAVPAGEG